MDWTQPPFWLPAWQIILINILLSGDNAVVVALACHPANPAGPVADRILSACLI
jgi:predicted tellurium resistance membrane protein TerC